MLTWPGRLLRWSGRALLAFLRFLRALPRLLKEGTIALAAALRDGAFQLVGWLIGLVISGFQAVGSVSRRLFGPAIAVLNKRFEVDPSRIPSRRLTVSQRGRTVAIFSRQLASMTQGGVPLLQSLDVLSEQAEDANMGHVSRELASKLGQGYSLSKATSEYPRIFPPVFFHLLKTGEETGRLIEVIQRVADLLERDEHLLKKVKSALSYPIFVLVLTSILTLGLFSTVLPGFADFYKDFKVPLPAITAFLMAVTELVRNWWFWLLLALAVWGTIKLVSHSWQIMERRLVMYKAILWLPLVGPILRYSCLARLCWVMELTQEAGLDVIRAFKLACLASGSPLLEVDARRVGQGITEGEHLSDLMLQRPEVYPHLLQQMVMMGEETSRNSDAFGRAATWFAQEVEGRIDSFQAALEPILMGLISVVVGTIVLAVFLPLYGLLDKLGV